VGHFAEPAVAPRSSLAATAHPEKVGHRGRHEDEVTGLEAAVRIAVDDEETAIVIG